MDENEMKENEVIEETETEVIEVPESEHEAVTPSVDLTEIFDRFDNIEKILSENFEKIANVIIKSTPVVAELDEEEIADEEKDLEDLDLLC